MCYIERIPGNRYRIGYEDIKYNQKISHIIELLSKDLLESGTIDKDIVTERFKQIGAIDEVFFSIERNRYTNHLSKCTGDMEILNINNIEGYTPSDLMKHLRNRFMAYTLETHYRKYEEDSNILIFSHRFRGWFNTKLIELSKDMGFVVKTNFGYARASYFKMVMYYRGFPLLRYSELVYYNGVNASTDLSFTKTYRVHESNWKKCFQDVLRYHQELHETGHKEFIQRYVITQLETLTRGLNSIANHSFFYLHKDVHLLNEHLGLSNRQIFYDYEVLRNNVNPEAINRNELKRFVQLFFDERREQDDEFSENNRYAKEVLAKEILPHIDRGDFIRARYEYALLVELTTNADFNLDTDKAKLVVSAIISDHYQAITYKHGIDLHHFRTIRAYKAKQMIAEIEQIGTFLNVSEYVDSLKDSINSIYEQNLAFFPKGLLEIAEAVIKLKELEECEQEMISRFERSEIYQEKRAVQSLFDVVSNLMSSENDMDRNEASSAGEQSVSMLEQYVQNKGRLSNHMATFLKSDPERITENYRLHFRTITETDRFSRGYQLFRELILRWKQLSHILNGIDTPTLTNDHENVLRVLWDAKRAIFDAQRKLSVEFPQFVQEVDIINIYEDLFRLLNPLYRNITDRCMQKENEISEMKKKINKRKNHVDELQRMFETIRQLNRYIEN